jgi:hypothetical protein
VPPIVIRNKSAILINFFISIIFKITIQDSELSLHYVSIPLVGKGTDTSYVRIPSESKWLERM